VHRAAAAAAWSEIAGGIPVDDVMTAGRAFVRELRSHVSIAATSIGNEVAGFSTDS
jgi:hypothetical protein